MNLTKCPICEQALSEEDMQENEAIYGINACGIFGYGNIELKGHKRCLENIDRLVVIPTRIIVDQLLEEISAEYKEKLKSVK